MTLLAVGCGDNAGNPAADLGGTADASSDAGISADGATDLGVPTDAPIPTDSPISSDAGMDATLVDLGTDATTPADTGPPVDATADITVLPDVMCFEAVADDGFYSGINCDEDPFICPSDYDCIGFSGFVLGPQSCQIPCEEDCQCPDQYTCEEWVDKVGVHNHCRRTDCTARTEDSSQIGITCAPGVDTCGDGYVCAPFSGIVLTHSCEIPCGDSCECPAGHTCDLRSDKTGTRRFCRSEPI